MRSLFLSLTLACLFLAPSSAHATNYEYTTFSALEAINDDGSSAYGGSGSITAYGIVINNPEDMINYSNYRYRKNYFWDSTEWQVFVQALPGSTYDGRTLDSKDFGGAALYMRVDNPFVSDDSDYYDQSEWTSEMNRVNCVNGSSKLKYGDVVKITANVPGLFYKGKYNINEDHQTNSSSYDFNIEILDNTTPVAETITLAKLKDDDNRYIFDDSRDTGCERFQGSLVHLEGLTLDSAASAWTQNGTVVVRQGDRTFNMKLGLDSDLTSDDTLAKLASSFNITAVLDQDSDAGAATAENLKQVDGSTGGYRLWLTSADMLTVPEPGVLILLVTGLCSLAAFARQKRK